MKLWKLIFKLIRIAVTSDINKPVCLSNNLIDDYPPGDDQSWAGQVSKIEIVGSIVYLHGDVTVYPNDY